ncbi:MAG: hypothetical protein QW331_04695 [Candidatus Woesearchaeota archaeon]
MKGKIDSLEVKRQLFHAVFGMILAFLIFKEILIWQYLLAITIVGLMLSWTATKRSIPLISWFLEKFERPEVIKTFPGKGAIYFCIGAFVVTLIFSKDIAAASVAILALGDSVCVIVGKFGKIRHPFTNKKYLEGAIAGIIAGTGGAHLFVPIWQAAVASFFAMIVEGIELEFNAERVDDNLIIPLTTALVIYFYRIVI